MRYVQVVDGLVTAVHIVSDDQDGLDADAGIAFLSDLYPDMAGECFQSDVAGDGWAHGPDGFTEIELETP